MSKETQNTKLSDNKALHIADFISSFKLTLEKRLKIIKEEQTLDEWQDGVKFGREDMLEELIEIINRDYLN